ncbi:hypothetical protein Gotur_019891 [Gossypium turneri]
MSIVEDYNDDESDDERENKEILQRMECFNRLFVVTSSSMMSKMIFTSLLRVLETRYNLQTSRNISSSEMLGIFLYILGTGAKVFQCRERFQRSGSTISRHFAIVLEKVSRMATDLIAPKDPFFSSIPEQIRNDSRYMSHFKDCIGAIDGTHITAILPPNEEIPYIGRKGYLGPYRGPRYQLPDFRRGRPVSDFMEYKDFNWAYENIIDLENAHGQESDDDDDDDDDGDDDGESNNSSGFEMELIRDAITSSLMNSL